MTKEELCSKIYDNCHVLKSSGSLILVIQEREKGKRWNFVQLLSYQL